MLCHSREWEAGRNIALSQLTCTQPLVLGKVLAPSSGGRPIKVCKSRPRLALGQPLRKYVALNPPLLNSPPVPP